MKKAIEIKNAKISYVSLVDRPANKRKFLIAKAEEGEAEFLKLGKIIKVDNDSHFLTGIVYEPYVEDAHGNFMTEEEIRKAAYWFAKNGDMVDVQHSFNEAEGLFVVENYIAPCDMDIEKQKISKGTWLLTVEVCNQEVWAEVQKGRITGFSMAGLGTYSRANLAKEESEKDRITGLSMTELGTYSKADLAKEEPEKGKDNKLLKRLLGNLKTQDSKTKDQKPKEDEGLTQEEVAKIVDEKIEKALRDLKSARGIYKNLDEDIEALELNKADDHFLKGLI